MAMPITPSFEGDIAVRRWAARDPLLNLRRDAQVIWPKCNNQQHAKCRNAVHHPTEQFQARGIGPMRILEDHQHRILACQGLHLRKPRYAGLRLCMSRIEPSRAVKVTLTLVGFAQWEFGKADVTGEETSKRTLSASHPR